jgi:hypothetical protein
MNTMRNVASLFGVAVIAFVAYFGLNPVPAQALEPGVFTQCVAWNGGTTYAILGASYRDRCFQLARMCTGNPNPQVTWYGSPVYVETPYTQCRPQ